MEIKDIELTPPSKEAIKFFKKFIHEHDKGLKAIKTLEEIREICNKTLCDYLQCSLNYNHSKDFECEKTSCNRAKRREFILKILQKINEVIDE